ncbi:class II aldolase/adducin family protein [Anaerorhabdus sp.]|uniref:class II aldolase/adducin family protein n=1 Tax=Anaerorhabdus sp. TaxID=1872524 RepID=UPI002FC75D43
MLEKIKEEVLKVALEAQRIGLCKHKSGNFSIRDKETGYVCITPSGVDRECLKISDISVLDQDLKLIEGLKPSSEALMHIEVYKACPDAFGIAHTHSKMGTSFAVLNKPIPAVIYEIAGFRLADGKIPVAPYGRPGTIDLAKRVAETAVSSDMLLMEKHGVIALGPTLQDAFLSAQYIEEVAEIYFNTLVINQGKEPEVFTKQELESWKYPEVFTEK